MKGIEGQGNAASFSTSPPCTSPPPFEWDRILGLDSEVGVAGVVLELGGYAFMSVVQDGERWKSAMHAYSSSWSSEPS